jgi:hypothetical protein
VAAEIPDGAFLVARAIFNSSLWTMPDTDRILAITCIGIANWRPRKIWIDGKEVEIKRGQFLRSLEQLREASRLSMKNVRTSLNHLISAQFMAREAAGVSFIYTVCKYDTYQDLTKYADSEWPEVAQEVAQKAARHRHEGGKRPARGWQETGNKQESYKGNNGQEREELREDCAEPAKTPLPAGEFPKALRDLPLYATDPKLVGQYPGLVMTWRVAYPGINIETEIAKAHAWEMANPKQRKVNRARFLNSWLARAQDEPRPGQNVRALAPGRSDGNGKTLCVACGGSKKAAGDVKDGKVVLVDCPRCTPKGAR